MFQVFFLCILSVVFVYAAEYKFDINQPDGTNVTEAIANAIFGITGSSVKDFESNDRISVDPSAGSCCKGIKVVYPVFVYEPSRSGGRFHLPLPESRECTLRFEVKFSGTFDFETGGDLHGLCVGNCRGGFPIILGYELEIKNIFPFHD